MSQNISELNEHEKGISKFFDSQIHEFYEEVESKRGNFLKIFKQRQIIAICLIMLWLVLSVNEIFSGNAPKILTKIEESINSMNSSYGSWYGNLNGFISFFLPSKVIFLPFPSAAVFFILASLLSLLWMILPALRFNNTNISKQKAHIIIKLVHFIFPNIQEKTVNLYDHCDMNFFYENAILPAFDEVEDCEICNFENDGFGFNLFETKLFKTYEKSKINLVSFQGLVMKITQIKASEAPKKSSAILFALSEEEEKKELDFSSFKEVKTENGIKIFNDAELVKPGMTEILAKYNKIFNEHNDVAKYGFDQRIFNHLNRKYNINDKSLREYGHFIMNSNSQIILQDDIFYIMIPVNREIFAKKSVNQTYYREDDLKIFLAAASLSSEFIKCLKN